MRTLTPEREGLKQEALRLFKRGWSGTAIGERIGVPWRTVYNWIDCQNAGTRNVATRGEYCQNGPSYIVAIARIEDYQPERAFPLIIADPPGAVSSDGHGIALRNRRSVSKDFGAWDHYRTDRTYHAAFQQWVAALYRLAANDAWLVLWHPIARVSAIRRLAERAGWQYRTMLYWAKPNAVPHFTGFAEAVEPALLLTKGDPRWAAPKAAPMNFHRHANSLGTWPLSRLRRQPLLTAPRSRSALLREWIELFKQPGQLDP